MELSYLYVDEKYRKLGFSKILLSHIVKIAQIKFGTEVIVLYRIPQCRYHENWLKQYYENIGFIDLGLKKLMYANINTILANCTFQNILIDSAYLEQS